MRVYSKGNKKYLSVTSIIGLMYPFDKDGFQKWAYSKCLSPDWITKHSATLGERYHAYFENRYYGISDWADEIITDTDREYHKAVQKFFDQGWEILESEVEVYCDEYKFAGRFDLLMRNKEKGIDKAVADIKTWGAWNGKGYKYNASKMKKVANQLTMYRYAMGEKIPLYLIVPQQDEVIISPVKADYTWKKWLDSNTNVIDEYIS